MLLVTAPDRAGGATGAGKWMLSFISPAAAGKQDEKMLMGEVPSLFPPVATGPQKCWVLP